MPTRFRSGHTRPRRRREKVTLGVKGVDLRPCVNRLCMRRVSTVLWSTYKKHLTLRGRLYAVGPIMATRPTVIKGPDTKRRVDRCSVPLRGSIRSELRVDTHPRGTDLRGVCRHIHPSSLLPLPHPPPLPRSSLEVGLKTKYLVFRKTE